MLEKDKNCIEFSMRSMMATHKPYQEDTEIAITGLAPGKSLLLANNPFDIPCDVVVVSKRYFERLQADNQHCREMSKQWEENHNLLLKKTGFDTVESLVFYLTNVGCDTLLKTLASYISERDKAEALKIENEQLKKELHGFDPTPEFKELLKKLYSTEDVEKLEWFLNHVCGGLGSATGWRSIATFWKNRYNDLFKLVGFSSVEEIQDYLTNEAECDTLHEAISKLKDQVKYTCDEWYSANSRNNSWKAAAECNTPKELIEKLNLLRDDISGRSTVIEHQKRTIEEWQKATGYLRPENISAESMVSKSMANEIKSANEKLWSENKKCEKRIEALEKEIEVYSRALKEWKDGTGCPSPSAAKTMIEYWLHAYGDAQKEIESLKKALRASNSDMQKELDQEITKWQDATGRIEPEGAKQYIERLKGRLNKIHDCAVDW